METQWSRRHERSLRIINRKRTIADPVIDVAITLMTKEDVEEVEAVLLASASAFQAAMDADEEVERVQEMVLRRILDRVPTSFIMAARSQQ